MKKLKNLDLYVGALFFVVMVLLIIANVILRYVFKMGISWAEELTLILFAWSTYLGIVAAVRYDQHVKMDIIFKMFPEKVKRTVDLLTETAVVALGGYITYLSIILCQNAGSKRTLVMRLPANLVNACLVVSFALITIWSVIRVVQKIRGTFVQEVFTNDISKDLSE